MTLQTLSFAGKLNTASEDADIILPQDDKGLLPIELFIPDSGTAVLDNDFNIWDAEIQYDPTLEKFIAGKIYDISLTVPIGLNGQIKPGVELNFARPVKDILYFGKIEIL